MDGWMEGNFHAGYIYVYVPWTTVFVVRSHRLFRLTIPSSFAWVSHSPDEGWGPADFGAVAAGWRMGARLGNAETNTDP